MASELHGNFRFDWNFTGWFRPPPKKFMGLNCSGTNCFFFFSAWTNLLGRDHGMAAAGVSIFALLESLGTIVGHAGFFFSTCSNMQSDGFFSVASPRREREMLKTSLDTRKAAGASSRAFELLYSVLQCNFRTISAASLDLGTCPFSQILGFLAFRCLPHFMGLVLFAPLSVGWGWLMAIGVAFFPFTSSH